MMKKLLLLIVAIATISLVSCKKDAASNASASGADTTAVADSTAAVANADTTQVGAVDEQQQVVSDNEPIEAGVYQVVEIRDGGKMLRMKPSDDAKLMKAFGWDQPSTKPYILKKGDYVEATGKVENGYAKVKDHLYYDMSESSWDAESAWIKKDCLKRVKKCPHTHDLADGNI